MKPKRDPAAPSAPKGCFAALVGLSLRALLQVFSIGRGTDKKTAATGRGAMAFLCLLSIYIQAMYGWGIGQALAELDLLALLPAMMAMMACLMSFFFTVPAAGGMIFSGKDNDLLLALPVPAFELLLAKTAALYLENLIVTGCMMLTAGVVFALMGGTSLAAALAGAVAVSVLLAFLPALLALLIGYLMTWVRAKAGTYSLVGTLGNLAVFGVILVLAFRAQNLLAPLFADPTRLIGVFSGPMFVFGLAGRTFGGGMGALLALAGLAAVCGIPFLAAVWLLSRRYQSIVTRLGSHRARQGYRLAKRRNGGPTGALLKKEARRFFLTPVYFINSGFGLVALVLCAAAACIRPAEVRALLSQMGLNEAQRYAVICAAVLMLLSMSNTASSSISLEGKNLWILQSAPVSTVEILLAKAGFGILAGMLPLAVSVPALGWAMGFGPGRQALLLLAGTALCVFDGLLGVWWNLCFPKLDAANETVVVKQSLAASLGIFGGMLLVLAFGLAYWFVLSRLASFELFLLEASAELLAGSVLLVQLLKGKGAQRFWRLG